MLLQLALVGSATIGLLYYRSTMDYRKIKPYIKKWEAFMSATGIKNKKDETFAPVNIEPMENGVVYLIDIPAALKVEKLEEIKNEINTYISTRRLQSRPYKRTSTFANRSSIRKREEFLIGHYFNKSYLQF